MADDPAAFADATVRLLTDRELATRLGLAGRSLAAHYDWDILVERLERTYHEALAAVVP